MLNQNRKISMKKYLLLSLVSMFSLFISAQITTWKNDPAHSRLGFVVKHLTISEIEGYFSDFNAEVVTSKADYSDMKIKVTAKIASINTGVEMRDNHLKSADFFDAEKYPEMVFNSTKVLKLPLKGAKQTTQYGKIYGTLTFHGITKPIVLDVKYYGKVVNPMNNNETAGFNVTGSVSRKDFDLGPKFPEAMVSDKVIINANLEFSPQK